MLEQLKSTDFAPYLHQTFYICPIEADKVVTELIEVKEWGSPVPKGKRQPFSLIFRGSKETVLPQQIYEIEHEMIGKLEIFLVPIGFDQVGMCYQAIFT